MSGAFLRHRSRGAREAAVRDLEVAVRQVAGLVLKASALADRMEARPTTSLEEARQRVVLVRALRDAAGAGRAAMERSTAHLAGGTAADEDQDAARRA